MQLQIRQMCQLRSTIWRGSAKLEAMSSTAIIQKQAGKASGETLTLHNRFELANADGWVLLAPYGDHPHGDYIQRIDAAVAVRLVNRWESDGKRDLPVDFDHRTYVRKDDTEAAGWIKDLQARADGFYARIQWTDAGDAALTGGRYRRISPTWDVQTVDSMDHGRTRVVVPVQLRDAALTNDPNIKTLPFLSNRAPRDNQKAMKELYKALGLGEEATEAQALAKIADLKGVQTTLQNRCNELATEVQSLREAQVEADLAQYADVIGDKESAKTLLLHNRAAAVRLFEDTRARLNQAGAVTLTNRNAAKTPGKAPEVTEKTLADQQLEAVERIRLANRCTHEEAWKQARRERPELFTFTERD